jgi:hypothetical protein
MNLKTGIMVIVAVFIVAAVELDTFGLEQFYPTKAGTVEWNSAHWNNGVERTVRYSDDQYDPTNWTEDHSGGTDGFFIDGKGTMRMSGSGPRFHINSLDSSKVPPQFFRDVEFTAYYRRRGTQGKDWGGMVAGVRSGPLGHASEGGDNCDATTYYARFRNDGKWDFEKELKHPGSDYWSGSGFHTQDPLWGGAPLPLDKWIGMKFIAYNIDDNSKVRLELYIDSSSWGYSGKELWEPVGTVIDSGNWPSGDVNGCDYEQNAIILEGNGTVLMRTDGDTAIYKWVSVREIDPTATTEIEGRNGYYVMSRERTRTLRQVFFENGVLHVPASSSDRVRYQVYTLRGRLVKNGVVTEGGTGCGLLQGVYLVRMNENR